MPRARAITDDRILEFTEAWTAGVKVPELAAQFGCNRDTISITARRLGLPRRGRGGRQLGDSLALRGGEWRPDDRGVQRWHGWAS